MTTELEKLREPFTTDVIKTYKVGGKDVPFAGSRAYMDRLDQVVGPERWQTAYEVLNPETCAVECRLSIATEAGWVTKSDVGYPNSARDADDAGQEPLKAAYSDAFKRAAVQWGVGRFLYDYAPGRPAAAPEKPAFNKWGSFAKEDGSFDAEKWSKTLTDTHVTADSLKKHAPNGGAGWLKANPGKTLDDLLLLASQEEAA